MKLNAVATAAICSLALGACGGTNSSANYSAEGFWTGTTTAGLATSLVVLSDGQAFGMTIGADGVHDGLYGSIVGSGAVVTGKSGKDFNYVTHVASDITYTGSVAAKATLAVTSSSGIVFNSVYQASYDQVPALALIAATYTGVGAIGVAGSSESMPLTIAADGTITVTGATCTGTGASSIRTSGGSKNIYNVSVNFTGDSCVINGQTVIGIITLDTSVVPARTYIMAVENNRGDGFFWSGTH